MLSAVLNIKDRLMSKTGKTLLSKSSQFGSGKKRQIIKALIRLFHIVLNTMKTKNNVRENGRDVAASSKTLFWVVGKNISEEVTFE